MGEEKERLIQRKAEQLEYKKMIALQKIDDEAVRMKALKDQKDNLLAQRKKTEKELLTLKADMKRQLHQMKVKSRFKKVGKKALGKDSEGSMMGNIASAIISDAKKR